MVGDEELAQRTRDLGGVPNRLVVHVVLVAVSAVLSRGVAHHVDCVDEACGNGAHALLADAGPDICKSCAAGAGLADHRCAIDVNVCDYKGNLVAMPAWVHLGSSRGG